jgi:two-component system, OmpR family, KDP operon response regulator KdpE
MFSCRRRAQFGTDLINSAMILPVPARHAVLIVEDDEQLRKMYRFALTVAGFRVREAADGLAALASLEHEPPSLLIVDLGLPDMSGQDVVKEIAAQAHTCNVPILVVTGSTQNLDQLDVDCVLRKPVSPDLLLQAVLKCLASHASDAGTD